MCVCARKTGCARMKAAQSGGCLPSYESPNEMLKASVARNGGRTVQLGVPKGSEGRVEIEDEGRCFLGEQVEGGDGQMYTKATFLMAVTRDGQVGFDGGRVQWVHPFPYSAAAGEICNGKLEVPGSRQIPWLA